MSTDRASQASQPATERIPDRELGVAVVLVGLGALLTTVLVPMLGFDGRDLRHAET